MNKIVIERAKAELKSVVVVVVVVVVMVMVLVMVVAEHAYLESPAFGSRADLAHWA